MAVATKNRRARSPRGSKPTAESSIPGMPESDEAQAAAAALFRTNEAEPRLAETEPRGDGEFWPSDYQGAHEDYIEQVFFDLEAVIHQAGANATNSEKLAQKLTAIWEAIEDLSKWSEELRDEDFPVVVQFFQTIGRVPVDLERRLRLAHAENVRRADEVVAYAKVTEDAQAKAKVTA